MLKRNRHSMVVLLAMVLFASPVFSQIYNTAIEAKINMERNADLIKITGSSFNKTELSQSLRYVLTVIKNGNKGANKSKNDQSGRFILEPGQKKNLSTTTINANDKERIVILLLIYNETEKLLGMDRIIINGTEEDINQDEIEDKQEEALNASPDIINKQNDGVVLRGVVIEETKTKPGRDFYKMFYSLYSSNNINGDQIVTVKEVLALNNNTKIEIFIANEKVVEFFVRPQNEYLKTMSEAAIKKIYWELRKYKQNKNTKKYY